MITDTIKYWCDKADAIQLYKKERLTDFNLLFMDPLEAKACNAMFNIGYNDCNQIIVDLLEIFFFEFNKAEANEIKWNVCLNTALKTIEIQNKTISFYKSKT